MRLLEGIQHVHHLVQRLGLFFAQLFQMRFIDEHAGRAAGRAGQFIKIGQRVDVAVRSGNYIIGFRVGFQPFAQVGHDFRGHVLVQGEQHVFLAAVLDHFYRRQVPAPHDVGQLIGVEQQLLLVGQRRSLNGFKFKGQAGLGHGPIEKPVVFQRPVGCGVIQFDADGNRNWLIGDRPIHIVTVVRGESQRGGYV